MKGADAVRDALVGIEGAFDGAARRRVQVVRELGDTAPPERLAADHRALVEALLRREAADADVQAAPEARATRAIAEARAAQDARGRMAATTSGSGAVDPATRDAERAHVARVDQLVAHADGTWDWALDQAAQLVAGLEGSVAPDVSSAAEDYVSALRELRRAFVGLDEGDVQTAVAHAETALARLEQTLAG